MEKSSVLFKQAFKFSKENFWKILLILIVIPFILQMLIAIPGSFLENSSSFTVNFIYNLSSTFLIYLVQFTFLIVSLRYVFNKLNNSEYTIRESFSFNKRKIIDLFILFILLYSIVALGFLALIIPGIILALRFSFSFVALVIKDKKPMDSLVYSYGLVKGRTWDLFVKNLFPIIPFSIFGLSIVFLIAIGVLFIFVLKINPIIISIIGVILFIIAIYFYIMLVASSFVYFVKLFKEFEKTASVVDPVVVQERENKFKIWALVSVILFSVLFLILLFLIQLSINLPV